MCALVNKNVPVEEENAPVDNKNVPVEKENAPVKRNKEELIIEFCHTPRSISEIADLLGYKDKRSVRKDIDVLLIQGRIARTIPDKKNSKNQK